MSTFLLVLLAIGVAAIAIAALSFIRWRETRRLAFAREVVHHTDTIAVLNVTGESLAPWLSPAMLNFLGTAIQHHQAKLVAIKAPENQKVLAASENALEWTQAKRPAKRALPGGAQAAQQLREAVRSLLSSLKEAYKERLLAGDNVKQLLNEAKALNLSITLGVFQEKAQTAVRLHNYFQATHFLKRAEELLTQQEELPSEFVPILENIRQRINEYAAKKESSNSNSRLEQGAAKLSEDDNSWKKKYFD